MNVRVIAAANKDLRGLMRTGIFREDLYYRMAVVTIDLCAKTNGSWSMGPASVPIWGFVLDDGTCSAAAQLPGPVLGNERDAGGEPAERGSERAPIRRRSGLCGGREGHVSAAGLVRRGRPGRGGRRRG